MFSSYRSLVLGLTSKRYQITSLKTMRCHFSSPAEKASATISQSASVIPEMKDEYGDMDCSGETFITKNFELESGHVLSEAHVRLPSLMTQLHLLPGRRYQKLLILFAITSRDSLDRKFCQTMSFITQKSSLCPHCQPFK